MNFNKITLIMLAAFSFQLWPQNKDVSQEALNLLSSFVEKNPTFSMKGSINTFRPKPESGLGSLVVDNNSQSFCFRYQSPKKSFDSLIKDNELIERVRHPKTGKLLSENKSKKLADRLVFQALLSLKKMPKELLAMSFNPHLIYKNKLNYLTLTPNVTMGSLVELTMAFTADPRPSTLSVKNDEGTESFWNIESFKKLKSQEALNEPCWNP